MAWRRLFFLCLTLCGQTQGQNPNQVGASISEENILEHCLKNALNLFTEKVGMVTDVSETERKELTEIMMKEFINIQEDEERALEVKFIKRRVQFTNITDAISLNQRVFTRMKSIIIDFQNKTSLDECYSFYICERNMSEAVCILHWQVTLLHWQVTCGNDCDFFHTTDVCCILIEIASFGVDPPLKNCRKGGV